MSTPTEPSTPAEPASEGGKQPATGEPTLEERLAAAKADRDKWQGLSRKNESRARENADKARRFDELEAASKTEAQRLAERADAADQRVAALTQRAVKAEVKALAADRFADPSDAAAFLDLSAYVGDDGEVDTGAIEKDLAELLKAKPHLGKAPAAPSFDGGARTPAAKPTTMTDLIRQQAGVTK